MKLTASIAALIISISATANVLAHNKVVVIPLNDSNGSSVPIRIYYGSVTGFGALESGNIVAASRISEGVYSLEIDGDVGGCALNATKGSQGGGASNLYGNVNASVPSAGNTMTVRTRNNTLALDDTDFHFTAICPK